MHHVGSTAVKGLAAKPEIDSLVVVSEGSLLGQWQEELLGLQYGRGGDLMEGPPFSDVTAVR